MCLWSCFQKDDQFQEKRRENISYKKANIHCCLSDFSSFKTLPSTIITHTIISIYTRWQGKTGAYPSRHWVKGMVHPG